MSLLYVAAIRWLPVTLVVFFGFEITLGGNALSNVSKICCPPFDKRVELNGTVFCYATVAIPNERTTMGNYLCRNVHPHANLASFHSDDEVYAVVGGYAFIGLVYEFDEYTWRDGTPVDFTRWAPYYPGIKSSDYFVELDGDTYFKEVPLLDKSSRSAFCKMEAEHKKCP